jgi:hypothetical protein
VKQTQLNPDGGPLQNAKGGRQHGWYAAVEQTLGNYTVYCIIGKGFRSWREFLMRKFRQGNHSQWLG